MEILLLLILMNSQLIKVSSVPYHTDSDGSCRNTTTEYLSDDSKLCCRKCPPGQRAKQVCSEGSDTLCEECTAGRFYMENWNYSPNCFSCNKCKTKKGLLEAQQCSPTRNSKCACRPGMFCSFSTGADHRDCTECSPYTPCKPGYGVSVKGTAISNVKCERCQNGMFSNINSHTETCQPHTKCHGRPVLREGNATSDTVCEPETPSTSELPQSPRPKLSAVAISADPLLSVSTPVPDVTFSYPAKPLTPSTVTESKLAAIIAGIIGLILLFILIILLILCKPTWKKDATRFYPKVNTNGNCESGEKISQDYLGETQLVSFTVNAPEQQCLLETGEACSNYSQSSSSNETRTDGCSSHESIGPLQSTVSLNKEHSILSEPMTLINTEPVGLQHSTPSQPPSQPGSLQINTPVTANPHVNVNITVHIGNGSCGTSSTMPTDSVQEDPMLPLGEEEECFSVPQQEDGKQSLVAVQESTLQYMNSQLYENHE